MWSVWVIIALGIWLIASPFIFGLTGMVMWHNIIVGVLVGIFGYLALAASGRLGIGVGGNRTGEGK